MDLLHTFFTAIQNDPRIGMSHICLYCAVLQMAPDDKRQPALFRRDELMKAAKISGRQTFHQCISDLHEFGYLRYEPCRNHRKKNRVYLKQLKPHRMAVFKEMY